MNPDLERLVLVRSIVAGGGIVLLFALETWLPFFPGRTSRGRHALRNLALGGLNALVVFALFGGLLQRVSQWSQANSFGLFHWLGLPPWAMLAGAIVLFDGWMYWWHRAAHELPPLWRFHRMHHSDRELDVTSAVRFHTGEIAISTSLRLGVLALLGMGLPLMVLYEVILAPIIQFHHSNVRIPERLDRWLRAVIITPHVHRIHHSEIRREHDGNYGSVFSFWDRIFASWRRRENLLEMTLGLKDWRDEKWRKLPGMLKTPLR
jgi:sterol desaturase/sphingolipid hydroxylase (fatty acid hydroxylase superfamily)